ncbi:hypothetical protein GOV05_02580, partial [Candidatus Woesearchaeota archaeon]|nr:hypothetical protein [Candidatus Woesearchaeota archaeon]
NATTRLAEWMNSTLKYDPYEKNAGYCPTSDMCFATTTNPDTNGLIGGCANNNYFVTTNQNPFSGMDLDEEYQDFVCEDGYWGSRTRQNALDMVKMADGSRFLLFCDQARSSCGVDKSINYFNIPTPLNDFLGNPTSCILSDKQKLFTNFCALVIDDSSNSDRGEIFDDADKTIISFGIRKQLSDAVLQELLISAFGTDCQGATLTNNYVDCSATNGNLFFNNETWTFMYSKDNINNEISSFATHTISTRIWLFITNIFSSIWDFIVGEQEIIVNLQESMLSRVGAYNQIYFAKTSYGEIQAVMIRKQSNLSSNEGLVDVVQATMYNYTYCEETTTNNYKLDLSLQGDLIFNQEIYNSVGVQSYNCTKTGDITTITWVGKTNARIESNWLDITARIRPQN